MTLPEGWKHTALGTVLERVTLPVSVEPSREYREIGIRSHGKGIFHKPPVSGESLGEKRVFRVVPNALALNIVFAWEQAVAVTSDSEDGMIASHRFPMYRPIREQCDVRFLLHYFKTPQGKDLLELASPGGAGRNKTLGQKEFERLKLPIPPAKEQARIVLILDTWEQAIRTMKELLLTARQEKQAHMRQMLTPHHPADWKKNGWRRAPLAEIVAVDSESLSSVTPPDFKFRYISLADVNEGRISNSLPLHNFRTAPSRARRIVHPGDILMSTVRPNLKGYARVAEPQRECIASTGFAVLSSRHGTNINYVYHYLLSDDIQHQLNSLVAGSNYPAISSAEVADLQINIPVHELQVQIVKLLDMLDGRISAIATQVKMLESEKTALTQCLFSGRRRVTPCVRNAGAHA